MFAGSSSIRSSSSRRFGASLSLRLLANVRFALLCTLLFTLSALASLPFFNDSKTYTITSSPYAITNNAAAAIEIAGFECNTIGGTNVPTATCTVSRVRGSVTNLIASMSLAGLTYCQAGLSTFEGYYFVRGDKILIQFVPSIGTATNSVTINTLGSR